MKIRFQLALQLTFIVGAALVLVVAAYSQFLTMGVSGPEAAGPPPPVCSNKLDFSDACNSQYIAVIF